MLFYRAAFQIQNNMFTINPSNSNPSNSNRNQQTEDRCGNEIKRQRLDDAGNHLKVWRMCEFTYIIKPDHEIADPVYENCREVQQPEVQQPEVQQPEEEVANTEDLIERFAALEINDDQEINDAQEDAVPPEVQEMPIQVIGRTVVLQTVNRNTVRGTIQTLFDVNGERAIQIQTSNGENLIFTSSQMYGLEVLLNPNEDQLSPIQRPEHEHEVVHIDDDEVNECNEVVLIQDSDDDSDASTQAPDQDQDQDDQDDFPEVEFRPARRPARSTHQQPQQPPQPQQPEEEEERDCCAICLDMTDSARNFVSLDCGHQFHFACIIGNMANGGPNRNQCPMCRSEVVQQYDVHNEANIDQNDVIERLAHGNQRLQDELDRNRQHREDLTEEYVRVMSMNMQIGLRHHEERAARDALERRAEMCFLNERIAHVVANAANNDIRRNYEHGGVRVHMERQIRDLCMSFGMMAYDAQYDNEQYQAQEEHIMEVD